MTTCVEKDLFGDPVAPGAPKPPAPPGDKKRRKTMPRGYAASPGSGPKGETCRSCAHYVVKQMGGSYRKCGKVRDRWTGGPATDILARAPACSFWEKPAPSEEKP